MDLMVNIAPELNLGAFMAVDTLLLQRQITRTRPVHSELAKEECYERKAEEVYSTIPGRSSVGIYMRAWNTMEVHGCSRLQIPVAVASENSWMGLRL